MSDDDEFSSSWIPQDPDYDFVQAHPEPETPTNGNMIPSSKYQQQIDGDAWEELVLYQAGQLGAKPNQDDGNDSITPRVYLSVTKTKPAFLSNYRENQFTQPKKDERYNLEGSIHLLAKQGSESVAEWRKSKEQAQAAQNLANSERLESVVQSRNLISILEPEDDENLALMETMGGNRSSVNREKLPIFKARDEILRQIRENPVVVIVGETGSGKTTQLTQYLYEDGFAKFGMIACTQPRRVAAVSVARRVANEMGVAVGQEVGYTIRFEDVTSRKTIIRYMTDGVLLRESLTDERLDKYSVIIMDEAHERSLNTDVLFGVLKNVLSRRKDLHVVVTSATLESKKFSEYFGYAPIINVSGRAFNVEVSYMRDNPQDYVEAAVKQAMEIHLREPAGDILIFMTGMDDVECTCDLIDRKMQAVENCPPMAVLPIYAQLPAEQQMRVFLNLEVRKCVVATNIAETSLTISGIRYVIDCGFSKQKTYASKIGFDVLQITPISQAAATQRTGRAGRTADGKCWRLYSELSFMNEMLPSTIPEIQRTNLSNVILQLMSMGFKDALTFDFMDRPPISNFLQALTQLWSLRAIANDGSLTELGMEMVQFPLDPTLSKMLIVGERLGCFSEVLTIVSMLSVPSVFITPKGKEQEAENARQQFIVPESDHLTLLHIYNCWDRTPKQGRDAWCKRHYLHNVCLVKAYDIRKQLLIIAQESKMKISSCGEENWHLVRKAVCSAYFHQVAQLKGLSEYINLTTGIVCYLHPTSALARARLVPEYIVYHELVLTSKHFIHGVTAVDPLWLSQMAPEFFTAMDSLGNVLEEGKPPKEPDALTKLTMSVDPIKKELKKSKASGKHKNYLEKQPKVPPQPIKPVEFDPVMMLLPQPVDTVRRRRKMQ